MTEIQRYERMVLVVRIMSVLSKDVNVIPCFQSWQICVPTLFQNIPCLQLETLKHIKKPTKVVYV